MRNLRFLGANQVDLAGNSTQREIDREAGWQSARPPVWPDIDGIYTGDPTPVLARNAFWEETIRMHNGRAVALSPLTDWDRLRLFFDDDLEPHELLPGVIIRRCFEKLRVEPAVRAPSTRLGPNPLTNGRNGVVVPSLPAGINLQIDLADPTKRVKNFGAANVTYYTWNGAAWANPLVLAPGAYLTKPDGSGQGQAPLPADLSVDQKWTIADLIISGGIRQTDGAKWPNAVYSSLHGSDANGSKGDTSGGTIAYPAVWTNGTPVSPIWLGRCALDIWTEDGPDDCYKARLPSARVITLPSFTLPQELVAGKPDQQLLVVPSLNLKSAQFTFRSAGPGSIDAVLGSPLPDEDISVPAKVRSAVATGANGDGAASAILEEIQGFLSVIVGASAGNTVMMRGAQLVLKRQEVGA